MLCPKRALAVLVVIALIAIISVVSVSSLRTLPPSNSHITINPSSNNWPMFHHELNHSGYSTSTAPTSPNLLWNYTTDPGYPGGPPESISTSPAVADGYLYIGAQNGTVYCLNASSGERVWSYPTGASVSSSPAVAGGYVYVGSINVYCLDALNGSKIWSFTPSEGVIRSSPAVADGYVYIMCTTGTFIVLMP
jgi:outer membrane protein assembly factor BamB